MIAEQLTEAQQKQAALELRLVEHRIRALESTLNLWDRFVSFEDDELFDGEGREVWSRIGLQDFGIGATAVAYRTQEDLATVRNYSRWLALKNEFAINGHENRVSYVVGQGHEYRVEAVPGEDPTPELIDAVRKWLDEWLKRNRWMARQQEVQRRLDRDGEAFLRYFAPPNGLLLVRFIEPENVKTPANESDNPRVKFGIQFDEEDAETAVAYFVKDEIVEASEIQHRKANVDLASPRGVPTFYPVRKNLRRAEKLLEGISTLAATRTMTPWIEKFKGATHALMQAYVAGKTDVSVTSAQGAATNYQRLRPGMIRHLPEGAEIEYPPTPSLAEFVIGLQAELRAIASRLVMPEFMLTSDASNANYASTMVAEGPAVKMFERLQAGMIADDEEVLDRGMKHAITQGQLPADAETLIRIVAEGPRVQTRDKLKDAQADQVLSTAGVLSKATMAARHNLDWEAERENMEEESEGETGFGVPPKPVEGKEEIEDAEA